MANHFLFIASDYKPWPGGIAEYIDSLARGLMSLGDTVKVLAVVEPNEKERLRFLETYEPWVVPFRLAVDDKPANWLGRKCFSFLEILRCSIPDCRRVLDRTSFFRRRPIRSQDSNNFCPRNSPQRSSSGIWT